MPINDDIANASLSMKVGSLRMGARLSNSYNDLLGETEADIADRPGRIAFISRRAGREIGQQMMTDIENVGERRMKTLLNRYRKESGIDLKAPRGIGSLRFERGNVEKFMDKAAVSAFERARAGNPDPLALLRVHTRTVARSGVNAAHNAAVIAIAKANKKFVQGVVAIVTLDEVTSDICFPRSMGAWDLETEMPLPWSQSMEMFPGRPPWHFNCRTVLAPVIAGEQPPEPIGHEWFESDSAIEAFGADAIDMYRRGIISRAELIRSAL